MRPDKRRRISGVSVMQSTFTRYVAIAAVATAAFGSLADLQFDNVDQIRTNHSLQDTYVTARR